MLEIMPRMPWKKIRSEYELFQPMAIRVVKCHYFSSVTSCTELCNYLRIILGAQSGSERHGVIASCLLSHWIISVHVDRRREIMLISSPLYGMLQV